MGYIKVGDTYKLSIPADALDDPINWINQRSFKFFSTLKEIDGKLVEVRLRARSDYYIAALTELPKDSFYIENKFLTKDPMANAVPCKCELTALINRGCRCGAFEAEMKNQ